MSSGKTSRWLLKEPRPDAAARLICFPYAGAGASSLRAWPRQIGDLEMLAVQPPGRENRMRDPAVESIEDFGRAAAEGIAAYLDRPYALFGHCMGALLAYATLLRIESEGLRLPDRLYVSASLVPHRGFYGLFQPTMTDEELGDELRAVVATLGEPEPLPELLPMAIRVLRHDVGLCYEYAPPGPHPLPAPVTAIGWRDDPYVPTDELREWQDYAETHHVTLDGGPWAFLSAPEELTSLIEQDFAAAGADAASPARTEERATT